MASDDEEYYDSIDDADFEQCKSFCNERFCESESEPDQDNKLHQLVPFYTGNVDKSEIVSQKNSGTTLRDTRLKRKRPVISLTDQKKNRSYLTMFYTRKGMQTKPQSADSNRTTCLGLSPESFLTCDRDDNIMSCSESLYDRFLEKEGHNDNQSTCRVQKNGSEISSNCRLQSVSEVRFSKGSSSKGDIFKDKVKKPLRIGELGGLGPNIVREKLEQLRKRQDYGKTVSAKNRIKIMEKKVVQKLREEMSDCSKH